MVLQFVTRLVDRVDELVLLCVGIEMEMLAISLHHLGRHTPFEVARASRDGEGGGLISKMAPAQRYPEVADMQTRPVIYHVELLVERRFEVYPKRRLSRRDHRRKLVGAGFTISLRLALGIGLRAPVVLRAPENLLIYSLEGVTGVAVWKQLVYEVEHHSACVLVALRTTQRPPVSDRANDGVHRPLGSRRQRSVGAQGTEVLPPEKAQESLVDRLFGESLPIK